MADSVGRTLLAGRHGPTIDLILQKDNIVERREPMND